MIAVPRRSEVTARRLVLSTCVLAAASFVSAQDLPNDRAPGAKTVEVATCKQWLGTLASPEFEGRGTGQPGFEKAANFVAAHFQALGLEARGKDGTYFQPVPMGAAKLVREKTFARFAKESGEVVRIPAERLAGNATAGLSAKGDVVLLAVDVPAPVPRQEGQRGIQMPEIKGLDGIDVKGKVVLVHVRQLGEQPNAMGSFAVTRALQGKEAAAVLSVQTDEVKVPISGGVGGGRRPGGNPAAAGARRQPTQASFGGKDLQAVLGAAGMTIESLAKAPLLTELKLQAEVEIAVEESQAAAKNVFAVLPGSDARLKDEYVVIGSHLDHLGKRGDRFFPGADDDGSGTTGVMAVAQMFAKNPQKPARSILFVCFCGEEMGLIGSGHFADNCPIPLASIVSELQMDMIGRDEEDAMDGPRHVNIGEKAADNRNSLHLVGTTKLAPALHALCMQKNGTAKFDLEDDQEDMFGRSDHANFAKKGVPVAFFFTGLHKDYHQVTDTPDKIHYEKLLRVATYVYDIGFELATMTARPEIAPDLWKAFRAGNRSAPEAPAAPLQAGAAAGGQGKDGK